MKMFKARRMRDGDEDAVIRLLNLNFPHVAMTGEKLLLRLSKGSRFFVADEGGKVVGFCELRLGKNALLRGIAVKTGLREKGAGTVLVQKAVGEARKIGRRSLYVKVEVGNEKALRVYGNMGFAIRREIVSRMGERLYLMRKDLEN